MPFIRRIYYDMGTGDVIMWYQMEGEAVEIVAVERDLDLHPDLATYKHRKDVLGIMEWTESDTEIENSFLRSSGRVRVDVSQGPPTLVFDFTPPEREPDKRDEALLTLGVNLAAPIQFQATAIRDAMDIAVSVLLDGQVLCAMALCRSWIVGEIIAQDDIRRYGNKLYRCAQAHTTQADWTPDVTPAMWTQIGDPHDEWPEWMQPRGGHDAYAKDAKVSYNGKHWISTADANVWASGVYGWIAQ